MAPQKMPPPKPKRALKNHSGSQQMFSVTINETPTPTPTHPNVPQMPTQQTTQQSSVLIDHFNAYRRSLFLALFFAGFAFSLNTLVLAVSNAVWWTKPMLIAIFAVPSLCAINAVFKKEPGWLLPLQFYLSMLVVLCMVLLALTVAQITVGLGGWDYFLGHIPLLPPLMHQLGLQAAWQTTLFMGIFGLLAILLLVMAIVQLDGTYGQLRFTSTQMHQKALKRMCPPF